LSQVKSVKNDVDLPLVSALFITYRRFDLLRMSLDSFRRNTNYPHIEVVIADDGSGPEIQAQIRTLNADVYAFAEKNRGLGANNNNGIRHCSGKYILMIQDDLECCGPPNYLRNAIQVMEANPTVGIINFWRGTDLVDEALPLDGSDERCLTSKAPGNGLNGNVYYSDLPHVVSLAASAYVGHYIEGCRMEECELDYHRRWQEQIKYVTAAFPAYNGGIFVHRGTEHSLRTGSFRYRLDQMLMPVANYLKQRYRPLYRVGREFIRMTVKTLEKIHVVR